MKKEQKVSIKKLSEITGYSVATVSRVLNNKGKYSKETEKRVRHAISKYKYVPNMLAKGLRTNQIQTVGIIVPDITNEFFSRITLAVQKELFKHSYSAFICNTNERRELEEKHLELMRSHNISGIIFVCSEHTYEGDLYKEIPKIYVDRTPLIAGADDNLFLIQSDNYEGGRLAIRKLVSCGCKNIVAIFEKRDISPKIARLAGIKDELAANGMSDERIYELQYLTYHDAYNVMNTILDGGLNFDGLFCYNDICALGAMKALTSRGINVPLGVKVVGFDDISLAEYNTPSITSIHQPMEEMGALAADTMMQILNGEDVKAQNYVLPVKLMERETTR